MYHVYIIYNSKADKIYIGQTQDLEERLLQHQQKTFINSYTSRFAGEWKLVYKEVYPNRESALKREKQLKSFRGRQFARSKITSG